MNKVITINLNGVAFQLEEGGYDALRVYLEHAARRLEGNPDKGEILTDIEQAIADKFRALLGAYKTVVNTQEVAAVIEAMGPVEGEGSGPTGASATSTNERSGAASSSSASATGADGAPRRLYRITDGAMLGGVCNGIAAYINLDVTIVRLAFALLSLVWGTGILIYLGLMIIMPEARTSAEKAAASGAAATAQEFIKRAREGYYTGMRSFHDRAARREWKRKFRSEMRAWRYGFHQQMHEQARQWQAGAAAPVPPPPVFRLVFVTPLLSLVSLGLLIALFVSIYQLATHGAVLGFVLPPHMPLWAGILLLVAAYVIISWPIKLARYACYYPRFPGADPIGGLVGGVIGLFFLGFGVWMLDRHWPEFHEWLAQLPVLLRGAADVVQGWFAK